MTTSNDSSPQTAEVSIHSMTGFGRSVFKADEFTLCIEIKTVNHKTLKISTRLPDSNTTLQQEVETLVKSVVSRGACTISISSEQTSVTNLHNINIEQLNRYYEDAKAYAIRKQIGMPQLHHFFGLPGVTSHGGGKTTSEDCDWAILKPQLEIAMSALVESRRREGHATGVMMLSAIDSIRARLLTITAAIPGTIGAYQQKLTRRIDKLLQGADLTADPSDIANQVAYFADRSDISEELQRLSKHCETFTEVIRVGGTVGRRLEFLSQEMLREANTMASKSHGIEILDDILAVKLSVDKLREQTANIE